MRSGLGILAVAAMTMSACSDDRSARLVADWGCGAVGGIGAISGDNAPDWVLVGEITETNEAPAAFADIACNLAADGRPLLVGVSKYGGGTTDAEMKMLASLDTMIAKGAPLIVERIGGDDHPYTVHNKDRAEKAWAQALMRKVSDAGASRALLLLPHASAIAESIPPIGDRFAGYSPMPVFLQGSVVSLEIASSPAVGLPGPAIRISIEMANGFHGQVVLNRMTRPTLDVILPASQPVAEAWIDPEARDRRLAGEILRDAQAQGRELLEANPLDATPLPEALLLQPVLDLPEFEAE